MRRDLGLLAVLACAACGDDGGAGTDAGTADAVEADAPPPQAHWMPVPGTTWQLQLSGTIDTSVDVTAYDVDLFDTPQETIDTLIDDRRIVICYFSAGSHEDWRPDQAEFPTSAIGNPLDDWPGERWLDVRDATVRDLMRARMDLAVSKRCHGVDPDNVDGFSNDTGFPLTSGDQVDFNQFLAAEAHGRGLAVGLKNDVDQIAMLVDDFDWQLNEECHLYAECDKLVGFVSRGKAVFHVEYGPATLADTVCPDTVPLGFSTLIKNLELDAWRVACPTP